MDNLKTSADVLAAINEVSGGLPEGGVDPESDEGYDVEDVASYAPPEEEEVYSDPMVDYLENDAMLKRQWQSEEMARLQAGYDPSTGHVPQAMSFDNWKAHRENFAQPQAVVANVAALAEKDLEDLVDRYPQSSAGFLKKLRRGEVSIPEGVEIIPNALEATFLENMSEEEFRRLPQEAQKELLVNANKPPLRTRSLDAAVPGRKKPAPGPKAKAPTYRLPDLSQDDLVAAIGDYLRKHPEKLGRR